MLFEYIAVQAWRWLADTGINLALLILLAMLVPRAGRFLGRVAERRADALPDADESKSQLALAGVGIYIAQGIAFFLILIFFLQQVGFSLAGAAIPATVVSAAVGFGAQSIIADFLAGFFILTEKQYGVGDFVTFEGNGIKVSGDVIRSPCAPPRSARWSRPRSTSPTPRRGSASISQTIGRTLWWSSPCRYSAPPARTRPWRARSPPRDAR